MFHCLRLSIPYLTGPRSEENTSELKTIMRTSSTVFSTCLHPLSLPDAPPISMCDGWDNLVYPAGVTTISQHDPASYIAAARAIEASGAQALWLQHEYGIFGGPAGEMLLKILNRTDVPLLTTLHTVLDRPDTDQRRVLEAVIRRSARMIVMSETGCDILRRVHGVPERLIEVIQHGLPERRYASPDSLQPRFGFAGRRGLLTFDLIAQEKGIDQIRSE